MHGRKAGRSGRERRVAATGPPLVEVRAKRACETKASHDVPLAGIGALRPAARTYVRADDPAAEGGRPVLDDEVSRLLALLNGASRRCTR